MDNKSKEQILSQYGKSEALNGDLFITLENAEEAMELYARRYKRVAYLISAIFFYGNFKAETLRDQELQHHLEQLGLWPTTEDEVIKRLTTNED